LTFSKLEQYENEKKTIENENNNTVNKITSLPNITTEKKTSPV